MHTSQRIMPCASRQAPVPQGGQRGRGAAECTVHGKIETHFMQFCRSACSLAILPTHPRAFLTAAIVCAPRIFNKLCKNVRGFRAFPSSSFGSSGSSVLLAVLFKFACIFYLLNKQNFTQRSSQKKERKNGMKFISTKGTQPRG